MRSTRTRPLLVAVAAVAVAVTGVVTTTVATAPSAEAAPSTVRVITHNLEKKPEALEKVIALAAATTAPEVVLLQEVCADMLPRIRQLGFTTFHARRSTKCAGADPRLGEATVWTGSGASEFGPVELLKKDDQSYGMACLDLRHAGSRIRACSTHLIAGRTKQAPFRERLTARIRTTTAGWISPQRTVIVGGDFNTNPTFRAMDALYGVGPSANGRFREIAQTAGSGHTRRDGAWTSGSATGAAGDTRRKIDYVFVSKVGSRPAGGSERTMSSPSNHRILYGLVPLG
ncbi:endonuclease/exonuclease/phosphatase family protein [Oryzobacter telluris]|uniref:endonuclease/exonuclease/phosphatase family protein n=1 Tax=Oryzobacter telluris TaxID=3149179 RepID=UPI00370D70D5